MSPQEIVNVGIFSAYLCVAIWLIKDFGAKEIKTEKMEHELMREKEKRVNEAIFHGEFAFLEDSRHNTR